MFEYFHKHHRRAFVLPFHARDVIYMVSGKARVIHGYHEFAGDFNADRSEMLST
jgi:hypothetical protein